MNTSDETKILIESISNGDTTKIEQLIKTDPALADGTNKDGVSLLVVALYHGRDNIAELLAKSKRKPLDLTEAASIGHLQQVQQIVTRNPGSANSFSPDGFPVLALAAHLGRKNVVDYLLSRGANVNTVSNNPTGFTALTGALAGRHGDIARILLEKGADPNHRYEGGFSPLMVAAENGDLESVKLLLAHGADPNATAKDGRTPTSIALEKGHRDVAEVLRQRSSER